MAGSLQRISALEHVLADHTVKEKGSSRKGGGGGGFGGGGGDEVAQRKREKKRMGEWVRKREKIVRA